jgi:hypothetical protein
MEIDCESLIDRYLLIKNPIYTFNFPISIMVAIIVFGFVKAYNVCTNSYINQILIPVASLLLTMVIIDLISRTLISEDEKERLKKLCSSYMNDPNKLKMIKSQKAINMADVDTYNGNVDGFRNNLNNQEEKTDEINPLTDRSHLGNVHFYDNISTSFKPNPSLFQKPQEVLGSFPKSNIMCVGDTKTNLREGELCSGADDKPSNMVAPVPGPQWLPQNAETVQNRLKTNNFTKGRCLGNPQNYAN